MSENQNDYRYYDDDDDDEKKKRSGIFDFFAIARYFVLSVLFSLIIYGMRVIVLAADDASPTGQVGNGILTLYEVHNTGAAFGLFNGQPEVLIMAACVAIVIMICAVIALSSKLTQSAISALSLLTAGIAMNMAERYTQGYVIDYIHCDFMPSIPVFNTADIMIVFGALGLILAIITRR